MSITTRWLAGGNTTRSINRLTHGGTHVRAPPQAVKRACEPSRGHTAAAHSGFSTAAGPPPEERPSIGAGSSGHFSTPAVLPIGMLKVTQSNVNSVRLVGWAQDVRRSDSGGPALAATLTLHTGGSVGDVDVDLYGTEALQALQLLTPGVRVAVSGQLVGITSSTGAQDTADSPRVRVRAATLQLAVDNLPPGERAAARGGGGTRGAGGGGAMAPGLTLYQRWTKAGYEAGRSVDDLAAERGTTTPGSVFGVLCDLYGRGNLASPDQLLAQAFPATAPLAPAQLSSFVDGHLSRQAASEVGVVYTKDGAPKMTPIRTALLADAQLGQVVRTQEESAGGPTPTFNQLKIVLAMRARGAALE